jgi:RNA polymerase sigma factor (sigma-70 family)
MYFGSLAKLVGMDLHLFDSIDLFQRCAENREDSSAWAEFLHRYAAKVKYFIRGALRQASAYASYPQSPIASGSIQEGDLFQNVIVRLVENNCAAMKRFSGASENDLLAYLAVICRSTVLDTLRRNNALKRRALPVEMEDSLRKTDNSGRYGNNEGLEREILARELINLFTCTIKSHSGHVSDRDQLVFRLHFFDGLSYSQISQCKGINLSKAGVEKLLKRLVDRVQMLASSGSSKDTLQ